MGAWAYIAPVRYPAGSLLLRLLLKLLACMGAVKLTPASRLPYSWARHNGSFRLPYLVLSRDVTKPADTRDTRMRMCCRALSADECSNIGKQLTRSTQAEENSSRK